MRCTRPSVGGARLVQILARCSPRPRRLGTQPLSESPTVGLSRRWRTLASGRGPKESLLSPRRGALAVARPGPSRRSSSTEVQSPRKLERSAGLTPAVLTHSEHRWKRTSASPTRRVGVGFVCGDRGHGELVSMHGTVLSAARTPTGLIAVACGLPIASEPYLSDVPGDARPRCGRRGRRSRDRRRRGLAGLGRAWPALCGQKA